MGCIGMGMIVLWEGVSLGCIVHPQCQGKGRDDDDESQYRNSK
jgi:hypothetical protein